MMHRSFFLILLFPRCLYFPETAAQNLDSLENAIDVILISTYVPRKENNETANKDSLNILQYLSEGSRFESINSDSSLLYIMKALDQSLSSRSLKLISLATEDLGGYFTGREKYKEAMWCYLKSLMIEQKRKDEIRIADLYDKLGMVYYYMEVFNKSLDYNQKALNIYKDHNDTTGIAEVLSHLGSLHSSREFCEKRNKAEKLLDFQTAISYYEQSIRYCNIIGDGNGIARGNQNIAAVYNKMNNPGLALGYVQNSLAYYRKINNPERISSTLFTLGKTYYKLKDYNKSIQSFKESEKIALDGNLLEGMQYLYEALAMPYYDIKDYKNAYNTYIKYMTIRDSVYNSEKSRQIIELETKYQTELKQNEILRLTSEKKRKNNLVYSLITVIFLMGSSVYYYVRLLRKNKIIADQNNEIHEKKILELEKETLYLAARSVIEGEEAERSRLAGDLHNGLGGLLSGIKINLSSMKENAVITHDNINAFNHAISLLDTSISELRRIAHNLMPETLNHYGIKTALEDFCSQVAPAGQPKISLHYFGDDIRYSKDVELTIYRVIQELVNNALKHAEAESISIEVFSEPKRLFVQVADNGKGFQKSDNLKDCQGKGLNNISDRITALNGKIDIWSQPGEGTEISVEITLL